ncbi:peptidase domain-containing ABC transporter, partial [Oxalobacteraceae bacterium A2-2]
DEAAECGLACLAMIASYHGHELDMNSMRQRFPLSLKGARLSDLVAAAAALKLDTRALKLNLDHIGKLALPCVLHWDFNHFVVLKALRGDIAVLHDPARGEHRMKVAELSRHFTGVALELAPAAEFKPMRERRVVKLGQLVGHLAGWRGSVAEILLLALVLELAAVVTPLYMQLVVDQALVAMDRDLVTVLALGFLMLALIQAGFGALRSWMVLYLGTHVNLQMMRNLFRHLMALPMAYFERRHLGDIASRFESLNAIQRALTGSFLEAGLDGVMALTMLAMMLLYSPALASVAVAACVLYALLRLCLYGPLQRASQEHIERGAQQSSHFLESVRGIQSIKLFNRELLRRSAWQNMLVASTNAAVRAQALGLLQQAGNTLIFGVENVLVVWLGARAVMDGSLSVGMLFAFISYKTVLIRRASALVDRYVEFRMLALHLERVADVALAVAEDQTHHSQNHSVHELSIEVDRVSFRYADNEPWVLHNVSFQVHAGECVALAGPSGCGKSTMIKLLLGLLRPTSGEIRIGGVPLEQLGYRRYRDMIGTVMQDDQLFAGSIGDNISFFDPGTDPARIQACAALASVHDDITRMPMGYATLVGDMGNSLSGGQKQRILLARALYASPQLLVLDEATSHLDVERESDVNRAIAQLPLTRILVAHRPDSIRVAQRVVMINMGFDDRQSPPPLNGSLMGKRND